jgi:uncharacterized membrane protein
MKNAIYKQIGVFIVIVGIGIFIMSGGKPITDYADSTTFNQSLDSNIINHSRIPDSNYLKIPYDDDTN